MSTYFEPYRVIIDKTAKIDITDLKEVEFKQLDPDAIFFSPKPEHRMQFIKITRSRLNVNAVEKDNLFYGDLFQSTDKVLISRN